MDKAPFNADVNLWMEQRGLNLPGWVNGKVAEPIDLLQILTKNLNSLGFQVKSATKNLNDL
ncbi:MAG: hypothetical protein H0U72_14080 [Nitrosospira sp.]|nr:hypothetical protein [Nitrosospira sp.]